MMFLQGNALPWQTSQASKPHTAYINIQDEIKAGATTDAAHIIPAVQAAFDNPKAKALICAEGRRPIEPQWRDYMARQPVPDWLVDLPPASATDQCFVEQSGQVAMSI